jgi:hypothetical protein
LIQPELELAMLRFEPHGTIHEHAAAFEIDVVCLEGEGYTSIDGEVATFKAGQMVRWPALKAAPPLDRRLIDADSDGRAPLATAAQDLIR